jgi:hypothetical protein
MCDSPAPTTPPPVSRASIALVWCSTHRAASIVFSLQEDPDPDLLSQHITAIQQLTSVKRTEHPALRILVVHLAGKPSSSEASKAVVSIAKILGVKAGSVEFIGTNCRASLLDGLSVGEVELLTDLTGLSVADLTKLVLVAEATVPAPQPHPPGGTGAMWAGGRSAACI